MKRLFLLPISALLMLISFASCEDDDVTGVVPVWGEVSFDPAVCHIGEDDSVTVRVAIDKKSKYAQKCTFYFRMTAPGSKYSQSTEFTAVAPGTVEPTVKMAVPDSVGTYTVTFSTSSIYFNADLPNGTIAASTNAVKGTFKVEK